MNNFMKDAKGLASNPLGIIALFISMIYGFACLVVGTASTSLSDKLIWPLIWFLVIFPVLILISFVYLVVYHHQNLYAPKDYQDEKNFFRNLGSKRQSERLDDEIAELENADIKGKTSVKMENNTDINGIANSKEDNDSPKNFGINDKENNNELNRNLYSHRGINQAKIDYMLLEELAIRKLEDEYKTHINRQVQIGIENNNIEVDGICEIKNRHLLFEVKYTKTSILSFTIIKRIESMSNILQVEKEAKIKLVVVVIHEAGMGDKLRKQLYGYFKNNKKVEFKFYSRDKLLESFN